MFSLRAFALASSVWNVLLQIPTWLTRSLPSHLSSSVPLAKPTLFTSWTFLTPHPALVFFVVLTHTQHAMYVSG